MSVDSYDDILEPFEKLIEIEILGEKYEMPENNTLLRGFQFLSTGTISYRDLCWNGDCANCLVWLEEGAIVKSALSCRTKIQEKMKIVQLSEKINLNKNE